MYFTVMPYRPSIDFEIPGYGGDGTNPLYVRGDAKIKVIFHQKMDEEKTEYSNFFNIVQKSVINGTEQTLSDKTIFVEQENISNAIAKWENYIENGEGETHSFEIDLGKLNYQLGEIVDIKIQQQNTSGDASTNKYYNKGVFNWTLYPDRLLRNTNGTNPTSGNFTASVVIAPTPIVVSVFPRNNTTTDYNGSIRINFNCPMNTAQNSFYLKIGNDTETIVSGTSWETDRYGNDILIYNPQVATGADFPLNTYINVRIPASTDNNWPLDTKGNCIRGINNVATPYSFRFRTQYSPFIKEVKLYHYYGDTQRVDYTFSNPNDNYIPEIYENEIIEITFNSEMTNTKKLLKFRETYLALTSTSPSTSYETETATGIWSNNDSVLTFRDLSYNLILDSKSTITMTIPNSGTNAVRSWVDNAVGSTLENPRTFTFKVIEDTTSTNPQRKLERTSGELSTPSSISAKFIANNTSGAQCYVNIHAYNFIGKECGSTSDERYTINTEKLSIYGAFHPDRLIEPGATNSWRFYSIKERKRAKKERYDYYNEGNEYAFKFEFVFTDSLSNYKILFWNRETNQYFVTDTFNITSDNNICFVMLTNHNFPVDLTRSTLIDAVIFPASVFGNNDPGPQTYTNLPEPWGKIIDNGIWYNFYLNEHFGYKSKYDTVSLTNDMAIVGCPFEKVSEYLGNTTTSTTTTTINSSTTTIYIAREWHGFTKPNYEGSGSYEYHNGHDTYSFDFNKIGGVRDEGSDLYAVFSGKVVYERHNWTSGAGHGNTVIIVSEDENYAVRYSHLKTVDSAIYGANYEDQKDIDIGDKVGTVGMSGTTNSHLHITLYKNIKEKFDRDGDGPINGPLSNYEDKSLYDLLSNNVAIAQTLMSTSSVKDKKILEKLRKLYALRVMFDVWGNERIQRYNYIPVNKKYPYIYDDSTYGFETY
ncbi:MAG: hypothetical protein A2086_16325 [Spirochaetes bacterium GWD1_27_9]|nr:MAG: hypothetical protein A2Z98_16955 [Spirochaetes bacterium GWB1_27_13]OHD21952.1 MAG: hypothetical protein A2Y34_15725 [Spirochaetes bacterium GWC1_27_15]OHD35311.1 MAG: hypothetical protein A2086_16325 [Spirochaetes bacterium GWD1_27_9]